MAYPTSSRAINSTPQYPVLTYTDESKTEKHAIVCIFSNGFDSNRIGYLEKIAKKSGMPHQWLGELTGSQDSSKNLSAEPLLLMKKREDDDIVHRIYLLHGGVLDGKHFVNVRHGDSKGIITKNLMRAIHLPDSESMSQDGSEKKVKNIDYHLACHSAKLRNEFSPDDAFWASHISLIFSSKKATAIDHVGAALESALNYASYCNNPDNHSTLNQFKLFLHAGMRRGDCLTMLGGDLKAPLIWHSPKSQVDLLPGNVFHTLRGDPYDCLRLRQAAQTLTPTQLDLLPPSRMQLRDVFFSRISRDDIDAVKNILMHDKNMINEKSVIGNPPLLWSIAVEAKKCFFYLLSEGADVNAFNQYGITALIHVLHSKGKNDFFNELLNMGANPNVRDRNGNSPLMIASSNGEIKKVEQLIKYLAKIDVWNKDRTALTIAVDQSDYDIVNALLMAGANASSGLDQKLIDQAINQDDLAIADLLKRSLIQEYGNCDSVDMEIDQPE